MMRYFFIFILFLSSCASLTKQGEDALIEGEYDKALTLFERALNENKNDASAKEGLSKARAAWLQKKLIDVRLFRLSNNIGESESLLLQIINHENEWHIFPTGAAYATQGEEIEIFAIRIQNKIRNYLEKKNPIAAQLEYNRHSFILEKALQQNTAKLKNNIYDVGVRFCKDLENSLTQDDYYTNIWLSQTCKIWNISLKKIKTRNSVSFFKDVKVQTKINGFSNSLDQVLFESIVKAFNTSLWHDPDSNVTLNLDVRGNFSSKQNEMPVKRVKEYQVQIPYEEAVKRVKARKQPQTPGILDIITLLAGSNERVVDNNDGTETVYTTKYRIETRYHNYNAVEMKSFKSLDGSIVVKINDHTFATKIGSEFIFSSDRHAENFPDIGLTPNDPKFISDEDWLKTMSPQWTQKLSNELQQHWVDKFCLKISEDKSNLSEREKYFRCAYQISEVAPENLAQYYLKNWEISFNDWYRLVKEAQKI